LVAEAVRYKVQQQQLKKAQHLKWGNRACLQAAEWARIKLKAFLEV
jgi:hypothetical protein